MIKIRICEVLFTNFCFGMGVLHKNWDNVSKNFDNGKVEFIFKMLVGCGLQYNFIFSKFIFLRCNFGMVH